MEENKKEVIQVPIEDILPNRFQPRLTFDEKELQELANSILRYGVIQPIVLRKLGDKYEIVAGERRYKASTLAGLSKIPAIIIDTDDNTSAEIALLENLQRKNLTVIEEAQSYKKLMDRGFTQDEIANKLGVSQSAIANKIRLLSLPNEVQDALLYNKISERHARCLLTLQNVDMQRNLLNKIINERLTVKQTEEEITLINNRDKIIDEGIPEDIKRFLNPEPKVEITEEVKEEKVDSKDEEIEVLDFKSDVIDISDPMTQTIDENNNSLNPFQESFKELVDRLDTSRSMISNDVSENIGGVSSDAELDNSNVNSNLDVQDVKTEDIPAMSDEILPKKEEPTEVFDEDINLPIIINKVRTFARELDNENSNITMDELDLPDSYQIIINISKK